MNEHEKTAIHIKKKKKKEKCVFDGYIEIPVIIKK